MEEHTAYIGLGANKGDRLANLRGALGRLRDHEDVWISRTSSVYETEAHTRQPEDSMSRYLNAVAEVRTRLSPEELLDLLLAIEGDVGRRRTREDRWEARVLDLDLLVYDGLTHRTERLTIPHPRLGERRFVLAPLAEIDPSVHVPAPFAGSAARLLEQCSDPYTCEKTELQLSPVS